MWNELRKWKIMLKISIFRSFVFIIYLLFSLQLYEKFPFIAFLQKERKIKMFYNHGIIIVVRIILAIIIKIQVFIKLHVVLETLKQSVKEFFTLKMKLKIIQYHWYIEKYLYRTCLTITCSIIGLVTAINTCHCMAWEWWVWRPRTFQINWVVFGLNICHVLDL